MVKYYCEHCRTLYDGKVVCQVCGELVCKEIYIEVQRQQDKK
ncbi:Uncharacterised protein [Mycobacteroides abscessus subsp. abscessus]|jgi:uncharacterized Zn finger protein (UPF0148 family)|nr:Uncharacterised protein [Mycobacteroides abscessus subsp. abscessus]